jgi:DNA replication protein DnaC
MARAKKATEAPTDPLDAMLARLQLSGIRDQLDSLLDEAARANLSARETLILLCEREIARKDHRRIEMGLKLAHFPAVKELAGFDFEAQPSIDPKQIRDLAASRWIANGENVLLLGPPESDSCCPSRYAVRTQALFAANPQTPDGEGAARWRRA